MKKIFAILLAVTMLASMATVVSAAESTTTLTTTVPAATYTLNIPADQEIAFGATETKIGTVTVTESNGFAENKNLAVTVTYDEFKCEGITTTIPFSLRTYTRESTSTPSLQNGGVLTFKGTSSGEAEQYANHIITTYGGATSQQREEPIKEIILDVSSATWGKALGGVYTATITFTAEVVVEQ